MFTILITVLLILLILALLFFWLKSKLQKKGLLNRSLQLRLLKIQLPAQTKNSEKDQGLSLVREKIALMEQALDQLGSIKNSGLSAFLKGPLFFSLEIVVQNLGKEIEFYAALPKQYLSSAEKAFQGVYPDSHIEMSPDYTIFQPDGSLAAASLKTKDQYLPLKSYQTLASDPLASVLNAMSKVEEEGEGLALQLILRKAPASASRHLLNLLKHLRQGKSVSQARAEMKKSQAQKNLIDESPEKSPNKAPLAVDQNLVDQIQSKTQKTLFQSDLRVIAGAKTQERADALLREALNPFQQFSNPEINHFVAKELTGRALQRLSYNYSFRLPDKKTNSYLSTEEIASVFHLPNTVTGVAQVASTKAKFSPAPNNLPKEGLLLGLNQYRGTESKVRMSDPDRARHFYVIGQTGTGKSTLLQNLIIQDIQAGKGVCFIDPHGDSAEEILEHLPSNRIQDLVYFNPSDLERPMGLNLLEYDAKFPEQKTFIINELLEIFNKLYDMKTAGGPMFEQYFRNATALVMDHPQSGNTLLEINRVFVDKSFRDYKLSKTKNPLLQTFWKEVAQKAGGEASLQNIVPYISSKFDSFLNNEIMRPIVAQEKSSLNFREIMDSQKILLINLSKGRLGELNSSLIGLIIVGKILMAALSRVDTAEENRQPFYFYIDEFQNVTTNSIETILSEARKYRLNLTIAHQFIGQLSEEIKKAVFGNVGSMASFRVGAEDAEFLEKQFAPVFSASDLINLDNFHCYLRLLINGQSSTPFSLATIKPQPGSSKLAEQAIDQSRLHYGRDKALVEKEIQAKFKTEQEIPPSSAGI